MNFKPVAIALVLLLHFSIIQAQTVSQSDSDKIFTKVESPASFPGGADAWRSYLEQNMKYPKKAMKRNTQGLVKVQFIVNQQGEISEVVALNDPGDGLAEEAIRIIKNSPKWIPAEQNKRKVIYRHIQSITFKLVD